MTARLSVLRRRPRQPMPADVRRALASRRLLTAYRQRPPYQRNDDLVSRTGSVEFG